MKLDGIRKTLQRVNEIRRRRVPMARIAQADFRIPVLRRPALRSVDFSMQSASTSCPVEPNPRWADGCGGRSAS
jgi:hypothetical protein